MKDDRAIGIIDSGVGGLTVVKQFRQHLPQENIIYFGDSANVPYGNKEETEIYKLTKTMVDFLIYKDVKLIVVACNTISSILDKYFQDYQIPIIGIIRPTVDYLLKEDIDLLGIIATKFTIESGVYQQLIEESNKKVKLVTESSSELATLIDSADYEQDQVDRLIDLHMTNMTRKEDLEDIVLACTHYAHVMDAFKKRLEGVNFIDPAYQQTLYAKQLMEERGILGENLEAEFQIFTSGTKEGYMKMLSNLSIEGPVRINKLKTIR